VEIHLVWRQSPYLHEITDRTFTAQARRSASAP
jgi:hypothetical protein